ncbi:hypothetical protein GA0115240_11721, partial [Streptomyces sp. DvalAA-14]
PAGPCVPPAASALAWFGVPAGRPAGALLGLMVFSIN